MLIKQKAYNIITRKAISLIVAIAFMANDLAFAVPEKFYQNNFTLAIPSQLTEAAFQEKFLAGQFLLSDAQVGRFIKEQILREREILKDAWESERVKDISVSGYRSDNGRLRNKVAELEKIKLVKVTGLLARTGQFAHVGLSGRDYGGIPVIYVDGTFANWDNDAVIKHDIEEIIQWEDLRVNILELADRQSMRTWMVKNADHLTPESRAKLAGTPFHACDSVRDIAASIHSNSHSIQKLYDYKKAQLKDIGVGAAFDFEKISGLFNYRSDDPEEDKKINIAASSEASSAVLASMAAPAGTSEKVLAKVSGTDAVVWFTGSARPWVKIGNFKRLFVNTYVDYLRQLGVDGIAGVDLRIEGGHLVTRAVNGDGTMLRGGQPIHSLPFGPDGLFIGGGSGRLSAREVSLLKSIEENHEPIALFPSSDGCIFPVKSITYSFRDYFNKRIKPIAPPAVKSLSDIQITKRRDAGGRIFLETRWKDAGLVGASVIDSVELDPEGQPVGFEREGANKKISYWDVVSQKGAAQELPVNSEAGTAGTKAYHYFFLSERQCWIDSFLRQYSVAFPDIRILKYTEKDKERIEIFDVRDKEHPQLIVSAALNKDGVPAGIKNNEMSFDLLNDVLVRQKKADTTIEIDRSGTQITIGGITYLGINDYFKFLEEVIGLKDIKGLRAKLKKGSLELYALISSSTGLVETPEGIKEELVHTIGLAESGAPFKIRSKDQKYAGIIAILRKQSQISVSQYKRFLVSLGMTPEQKAPEKEQVNERRLRRNAPMFGFGQYEFGAIGDYFAYLEYTKSIKVSSIRAELVEGEIRLYARIKGEHEQVGEERFMHAISLGADGAPPGATAGQRSFAILKLLEAQGAITHDSLDSFRLSSDIRKVRRGDDYFSFDYVRYYNVKRYIAYLEYLNHFTVSMLIARRAKGSIELYARIKTNGNYEEIYTHRIMTDSLTQGRYSLDQLLVDQGQIMQGSYRDFQELPKSSRFIIRNRQNHFTFDKKVSIYRDIGKYCAYLDWFTGKKTVMVIAKKVGNKIEFWAKMKDSKGNICETKMHEIETDNTQMPLGVYREGQLNFDILLVLRKQDKISRESYVAFMDTYASFPKTEADERRVRRGRKYFSFGPVTYRGIDRYFDILDYLMTEDIVMVIARKIGNKIILYAQIKNQDGLLAERPVHELMIREDGSPVSSSSKPRVGSGYQIVRHLLAQGQMSYGDYTSFLRKRNLWKRLRERALSGEATQFNYFMDEISSVKVPENAEAKALWERARSGDIPARDELVVRILPLIIGLIRKKYKGIIEERGVDENKEFLQHLISSSYYALTLLLSEQDPDARKDLKYKILGEKDRRNEWHNFLGTKRFRGFITRKFVPILEKAKNEYFRQRSSGDGRFGRELSLERTSAIPGSKKKSAGADDGPTLKDSIADNGPLPSENAERLLDWNNNFWGEEGAKRDEDALEREDDDGGTLSSAAIEGFHCGNISHRDLPPVACEVDIGSAVERLLAQEKEELAANLKRLFEEHKLFGAFSNGSQYPWTAYLIGSLGRWGSALKGRSNVNLVVLVDAPDIDIRDSLHMLSYELGGRLQPRTDRDTGEDSGLPVVVVGKDGDYSKVIKLASQENGGILAQLVPMLNRYGVGMSRDSGILTIEAVSVNGHDDIPAIPKKADSTSQVRALTYAGDDDFGIGIGTHGMMAGESAPGVNILLLRKLAMKVHDMVREETLESLRVDAKRRVLEGKRARPAGKADYWPERTDHGFGGASEEEANKEAEKFGLLYSDKPVYNHDLTYEAWVQEGFEKYKKITGKLPAVKNKNEEISFRIGPYEARWPAFWIYAGPEDSPRSKINVYMHCLTFATPYIVLHELFAILDCFPHWLNSVLSTRLLPAFIKRAIYAVFAGRYGTRNDHTSGKMDQAPRSKTVSKDGSGISPTSASLPAGFAGFRDVVVTQNDEDGFGRISAQEVADEIVRLQRDSAKIVNIVFATGRTMIPFLHHLAQDERIDWDRTRRFHLDEYRVVKNGVSMALPKEHVSSFAYFINKHFIFHIEKRLGRELDPANTHFISDYVIDGRGKAQYMQDLEQLGGADIMMVGIGRNGHLAFNRPGSLFDDSGMAEVDLEPSTVEDNAPDYPDIADQPYGYTMSIGDILRGRRIFFLARNKASIVRKALTGPVTTDVPASALQNFKDKVTVILDESAAHWQDQSSGIETHSDGPSPEDLREPGQSVKRKENRVSSDRTPAGTLLPDTKSILARTIPASEVKNVAYLACGLEFPTICDVLQVFPEAENIYLVDNGSQFKMKEIVYWFVNMLPIYNGLKPAASSDNLQLQNDDMGVKVQLNTTNNDEPYWVEMTGESGGRQRKVRLYFYINDCLLPLEHLKKVSDLTIARGAGHGGILSARDEYHDNIARITKDGKYVFMSFSNLPDENVLRGYRTIETNRLILPRARLFGDGYAVFSSEMNPGRAEGIAQVKNSGDTILNSAKSDANLESVTPAVVDEVPKREGDGMGFEDGRTLAREALGMDKPLADRERGGASQNSSDEASGGTTVAAKSDRTPAETAAIQGGTERTVPEITQETDTSGAIPQSDTPQTQAAPASPEITASETLTISDIKIEVKLASDVDEKEQRRVLTLAARSGMWPINNIANWFENMEPDAIVAYIDGNPVGVYSFIWRGENLPFDEALANGIWVDDSVRKKGVATVLRNELFAYLKSKGYRVFRVTNVKDIKAAQGFQAALAKSKGVVIDYGKDGMIKGVTVDLQRYEYIPVPAGDGPAVPKGAETVSGSLEAATDVPENIASAVEVLERAVTDSFKRGEVYTIRYDARRLAEAGEGEEFSALKALMTYVEGMRMRTGDDKWRDKVKLVKCDGGAGGRLISIERYSDISRSNLLGSSQVNVNGSLKGARVDVVTMLNMILAACEIPAGTPSDKLKDYSVMAKVERCYSILTGKDFEYSGGISRIILSLPSAAQLSTEALRDYYRLTIEALKKYA